MIKVTINGMCHEFEPGLTILEAARQLDLNIPTFCNHQLLKPVASCRVCLVEIDGMPRLQPSCATLITEGMVVNTDGNRATQARQSTIKLLLANHPLDCPICDKGGECELQDTVLDHGPRVSYFEEDKRVFSDNDPVLNKVIVANSNRCIQCQRCVRVCDEVVGASAIGVIGRGADCLETGFDNNLNSCDHCGNCIEVCPVGALMRVEYRYKARPWDLTTTDTLCPHCGTGCQISAETRNNQLVRVKAKPTNAVNKELLCVKGRFGIDFVDKTPRIEHPMVRRNNELQPVTWNEAMDYLKQKLAPLVHQDASVIGVISARMTNEVLFRFHQLFSTTFSSNQIYCGNDIYRQNFYQQNLHPNYQHAVNRLIGQEYTNKPVSELFSSDCVLVLGCNIGEQNPVSEYLLRGTFNRQPFTLLLASVRQSRLDLMAETFLRYRPGQELPLLQQLTKNISNKQPEKPEAQTVTKLQNMSDKLASAQSISLLIGSDLLIGADHGEGADRSDAAETVSCLVELIENLKQTTPQVKLQFLFQHCNGLGALDVASNWPGPTQALTQAMANSQTSPNILYIVDQEVPFLTDSTSYIQEETGTQLSRPQLMIYQGAFINPTMQQADIVLPGFSFAETDGTFTNNEGRVQRVRPFYPTKQDTKNNSAKYDSEIFSLIAKCLESQCPEEQGQNSKLGPSAPQRIFNELSSQLPAYYGLNWQALDNNLAFRKTVPTQQEPVEKQSPQLESKTGSEASPPFMLLAATSLYHSKDPIAHSPQLDDIEADVWIEISQHDASTLKVNSNDLLLVRYQISNTDQQLILPVRIVRRATDRTLIVSGDLTKVPSCLTMSPWPTHCQASGYTRAYKE